MHYLGFCFSQWCKMFVMLGELIVLNIGQTEETLDNRGNVKKAYANLGDVATLSFPGYGTEIRRRRCDLNRYEIWIQGRNELKRIFASTSGDGANAICVGDCNIYNNRGIILDDSENVNFFLVNTTKADQKTYCLTVMCRRSDDINSNCQRGDAISLVIVEPVTQLNHTMIGTSPVIRLGDQMQASCYANGVPPPDLKIINDHTGEVIKEGRTNNLSYSFHITERQRQVTLICKAQNNPEKVPQSQLLRVRVNYSPAFKNTSLSRLSVADNSVAKLWAEADGSPTPVISITTTHGQLLWKSRGKVVFNVSQPGVFQIIAYNGIPPAAIHQIEVISEKSESDTTFAEDNRYKNYKNEEISLILSACSVVINAILLLIALIILIEVFKIKKKIYKNRTREGNGMRIL